MKLSMYLILNFLALLVCLSTNLTQNGVFSSVSHPFVIYVLFCFVLFCFVLFFSLWLFLVRILSQLNLTGGLHIKRKLGPGGYPF